MNSWDCFDTLIARRFCKPTTVFDAIGQQLQLSNFTQDRIKAEKNSDQTYNGIYKNLPGIDPNIEQAIELEHCYPIVSNINKVKDGDLIISDIYYDAEFVEKLLRNCGLKKNVKFVVTSNGKSNGWIWPTLPPIEQHLGDNFKSDVKSANKHGVNAVLYTECHFSQIEEEISKDNYELACWMRYIRLQCPYDDNHRKSLWIDQANYNIPVLALASLELPNLQIAFNFRDCVYWKPIYESLTGKIGVELHTSRKCYTNPSKEFTDYVCTQVSNRLIVDLQGSGRSPSEFFKKAPNIIYIVGSSEKSLVGKLGDAIERHNCSNLGTLINIDKDGLHRSQCEHDSTIVNVQSESVKIACDSIKHFKIIKNLNQLSLLVKGMKNNYTDKTVNHTINHI
jgi:hypothetical protein